MDTTTDVNHMPIAYHPNAFFYQAVDNQMTPDTCEILDANAEELYSDFSNNIDNLWGNVCTAEGLHEIHTLTQCYKHELCRNEKYTGIIEKTNINHSGANGRFNDSKTLYNMEYLTLGNLSFGVIKILVVILLIYYNK
jgi:hypothetical protein